MLVLQHLPITCTHRRGSEIRLRASNTAAPTVSRTPKAPWNPDRAEWRAAYRDIRKFANVAISWLYKFAGFDPAYAYRVSDFAKWVFDYVLTDDTLYVDGVAHYLSEADVEELENDERFDVGARVGLHPRWFRTPVGPQRQNVWRLVVRVEKDRLDGCAWGCGQRAIVGLADRFATLRRRHGHVVGSRLENLTAHVIGDKLLEMWRRANEEQEAK